jgi:hypothetical protein
MSYTYTFAPFLRRFRGRGLTVKPIAKVLSLAMLASVFTLVGCGGGSSGSTSPTTPPPPTPEVTSVTVSPATAQLQTGASEMFTAQVMGTGAFNTSVNWSVNGIGGGNTTVGTIAGGQYTAPAAPPTPSNVTITATSVQDSSVFGTSNATVYASAALTSIAPSSASAGTQITLTLQNLSNPTSVVFSGVNGTSISMPVVQQISTTQITAMVPFGAATGPVSVNLTPFQGANETSNALTLTRLPNLRVHAPNKDLSSGETLQLDWVLLGADTPSTVKWTTNSGSVNSAGMFQAPTVTSESYSQVTGCIETTSSCNTVLLRILPFRVTPLDPIVNIGSTIQLDALQGTSLLSPQWSVLAGGGSITPAGLFTAPTTAAQAGPVPVAASANSTTEQTSVAVSGAYPGLVNRVYDYADYTTYRPAEATFVKSVAVSGNTAYTLTLGTPFQSVAAYQALDVYDITNPDQPVWINAIESANNYPADLFAYGNTLFSIDSSDLVIYSLASQVPAVSAIVPITEPWQWTLNNGVLYTLPSIPPGEEPTSIALDLYDMTTGSVVHNHYDIPNPPSVVGQFWGISGNGNIVYLSALTSAGENEPNFTIATYDISQSPPALLSAVVNNATTEYHLQVVGNLLFADSQVYDISNVTPVPVTIIPVPLGSVRGVEGNNVLASGSPLLQSGDQSNYVVVNISSPSSPVVQANVADLMNWDIFNPSLATWANNGRFYAADGTGGFSVYNVSASGGPAAAPTQQFFTYTYDQVIEQQTLYAAAVQGSGAGGLACFDISNGTPNLLGSLMYPNDTSYAVQVSGTNVFLGLADSLKVIDASNLQSPTQIASVTIPVDTLALSGNTLFVATTNGQLVVFDVSNPASPNQIASVAMPAPSTMRVAGSLLLVAAGQSGLLVFNVANPSAPVMLSQFSPSVSAPVWDVVQITGSTVLLAADSSGIVTVDISNPSLPQQLYQQPLPYLNAFPAPSTGAGIVPALSLAFQNGVSYVGTTAGIMFAFDATTPASPRLIAANVVGVDDVAPVTVITPGTSNLYLVVQDAITQLENSVPQNSVELYYPPAALSIAVPIGDVASRTAIHNLKMDVLSRRNGAGDHSPDGFGIMRYEQGDNSKKKLFAKPSTSASKR